ncbi:MAG: hypothetical protein KBC94_28245 [Pseudacidovorax sp.]|uniref:hypothetical protein n=1 Tax=Pseudacidovorax sp. TaxID=1934311 RepID=UPI001B59C01D|nr:hypothetical protein [Pseudacidovorax sp.]MBP6898326.1 hypothetical protein [Pseudacidovorax sp.]MBP6901061.1 hypothetical protein [Burkholderiaceae bacterium]
MMTSSSMRLLLGTALSLCGLASAQAASGQIDSFSANALSVPVGGTVDFTVSYSVSASSWSSGGADPVEPAPQEGYQFWAVNWYNSETETVSSISLQAGGNGFNDMPSAPAGSGHSGSWTFSMLFPQAGVFQITASGDWAVNVTSYYSQESASRQCDNIDPEGSGTLQCTSWQWQYSDGSNESSLSGSMPALTLSIEVVNAVPEPATWALWLAGAAWLTRRVRHGRGRLR